MGKNDKIKESKRKACKDAIDRTSNGLKGLISPFKTFKRGREDPVLASLENGRVQVLVVLNFVVMLSFTLATTYVGATTGVWGLTAAMAALTLVSIAVGAPFADDGQDWRWVRRWLSGRMRKRFEGNETEIHRLEAQLHTMWNEWLELDGDDEGKDRMTNHLYEWYKEAGLPMSDEFRDLFAAELGLESARRTRKALEDAVYEDEEARLRRLADKAVGASNGPGVSYDGGRLLYDGDDQRLRLLVERANKIAGRMETGGGSGSGAAFVAGLRVPLESLCKLSVLRVKSPDNAEVAELFRKSIRMFDTRLDREESRLDRSVAQEARMEYEVIGGLMAWSCD